VLFGPSDLNAVGSLLGDDRGLVMHRYLMSDDFFIYDFRPGGHAIVRGKKGVGKTCFTGYELLRHLMKRGGHVLGANDIKNSSAWNGQYHYHMRLSTELDKLFALNQQAALEGRSVEVFRVHEEASATKGSHNQMDTDSKVLDAVNAMFRHWDGAVIELHIGETEGKWVREMFTTHIYNLDIQGTVTFNDMIAGSTYTIDKLKGQEQYIAHNLKVVESGRGRIEDLWLYDTKHPAEMKTVDLDVLALVKMTTTEVERIKALEPERLVERAEIYGVMRSKIKDMVALANGKAPDLDAAAELKFMAKMFNVIRAKCGIDGLPKWTYEYFIEGIADRHPGVTVSKFGALARDVDKADTVFTDSMHTDKAEVARLKELGLEKVVAKRQKEIDRRKDAKKNN
jgi:hypothetical protein